MASKSEIKRQKIIDSAVMLFRSQGYATVRLSDIAKAAGTHSGAMYYYFDSKEELVEEVLRTTLTRITAHMKAVMDGIPEAAGPRQRLRAAIRGHLDFMLGGSDYGVAMMRILDQVPRKIRNRLHPQTSGWADVWRRIFDDLLSRAELKKGLEASVVRNALLGSLVWSTEWYVPGKLSIDRIADQIANVYFDGMISKARPARRLQERAPSRLRNSRPLLAP